MSTFGVMAEFATAEGLTAAATRARAAGYREMEAYSPFPVEGVDEPLGVQRSRVALVTLLGGISGGLGAYFMQWYSAVVDYPLNIGGRPLHSAPAFIPITFELTVLFAALGAVIAAIGGAGLPRPYHPVFNVPEFARASRDRFFLCIEASDPQFDLAGTRAFLARQAPEGIHDVEA